MLLQAAINGARAPGEHPALPLTPSEQARAAAESVEAGAGALHLHVREPNGNESLAAHDVARTLRAVRGAVPGVQLGVSTGAWIVPDPEQRQHLVSQWMVLPDYASVNFHEVGAELLAELLLSLGVKVEAGLRDAAAAERLVASRVAPRCLRILLEPADHEPGRAQATALATQAVLDRSGVVLPRLLHGMDATAWPMLEEAARQGLDGRIGLEDTLRLPDGRIARGNGELVAIARRVLANLR